MIGKYDWFKRRKYTGWGFSPATWQGWVYIIVFVLPIILLTAGDNNISQTKIVLLVVWAIIFAIDFVDIMIHLPKDERDRMHEAISERNALWVIIIVLGMGVAYQTAQGMVKGISQVDPVILVAIFAGLFTKIISNIYLDKKN